ncbi:hypothetical protein EV214_10287 [Marinisporobacter balticus]|uniref:DUF1858 domain-containing protein n=1 Tax=Marinisporobacter balticus TaxID=2018667 RepID=A0A4R2L5P8_9FIRM|nr:hypothetical protein EV214_10287 [Marinisporobacter balticus]
MMDRDTVINDILIKHPQVEEVFKEFGIRCFG